MVVPNAWTPAQQLLQLVAARLVAALRATLALASHVWWHLGVLLHVLSSICRAAILPLGTSIVALLLIALARHVVARVGRVPWHLLTAMLLIPRRAIHVVLRVLAVSATSRGVICSISTGARI